VGHNSTTRRRVAVGRLPARGTVSRLPPDTGQIQDLDCPGRNPKRICPDYKSTPQPKVPTCTQRMHLLRVSVSACNKGACEGISAKGKFARTADGYKYNFRTFSNSSSSTKFQLSTSGGPVGNTRDGRYITHRNTALVLNMTLRFELPACSTPGQTDRLALQGPVLSVRSAQRITAARSVNTAAI
jgi:hypothetical protein